MGGVQECLSLKENACVCQVKTAFGILCPSPRTFFVDIVVRRENSPSQRERNELEKHGKSVQLVTVCQVSVCRM